VLVFDGSQVEHGIAMFVTDESIAPHDLGWLVEQHGFESLFVPEHTHMPVERRMPHPLGGLRREHARTYDPFIALTAAAMATTRLRVGTGICLAAQHDPIVLAKVVASLDLVSGGRVVLGVGAGWNHEEIENNGTDPAVRFAVLRERVLAMRAIWTEDEAEFHGEHVDFQPIWSWPKPVQRRLPVLMGGTGPKALDRVLDYCDGWAPFGIPFDELATRIAELQRRAAELGRAPVPVTMFMNEARADEFAELEQAGVSRIVTWIEPCAKDAAERALEQIATAAGVRAP
jgi:probable F420-dependent oxidoreductase